MSSDHREGLHIRCFKHPEAPERARWRCQESWQESSMATTPFCCGLLPRWGSPRSNLHSQIGRRTEDPWASKATEWVWSRLCGINSCESWWRRLYVQLHHDDATERGPGTHCHQRQFLAVFFQQRDAPRQDYNEIRYSCWNLRSARSLEIRWKARCILSWLDNATLSHKFDGWGRLNHIINALVVYNMIESKPPFHAISMQLCFVQDTVPFVCVHFCIEPSIHLFNQCDLCLGLDGWMPWLEAIKGHHPGSVWMCWTSIPRCARRPQVDWTSVDWSGYFWYPKVHDASIETDSCCEILGPKPSKATGFPHLLSILFLPKNINWNQILGDLWGFPNGAIQDRLKRIERFRKLKAGAGKRWTWTSLKQNDPLTLSGMRWTICENQWKI